MDESNLMGFFQCFLIFASLGNNLRGGEILPQYCTCSRQTSVQTYQQQKVISRCEWSKIVVYIQLSIALLELQYEDAAKHQCRQKAFSPILNCSPNSIRLYFNLQLLFLPVYGKENKSKEKVAQICNKMQLCAAELLSQLGSYF